MKDFGEYKLVWILIDFDGEYSYWEYNWDIIESKKYRKIKWIKSLEVRIY